MHNTHPSPDPCSATPQKLPSCPTPSSCQTLFDMLIAGGHRLSEAEAKNFLPGLVEKSGQPAAQLRADCRDLMRAACELYPTPRVLAFVREGLDSKNNRTRVACAEEIGCMIDREGPRVYASSSKSEGVSGTGSCARA